MRLSDLGRVIDDASEQRSFARLDGEPVVTFAVFRSKGESELSVADTVNKKLAELQTQYPDVRLTKVDDAVAYTRGNYTSAMETLLEGAALAVLVVLLFLRNWRATLISAVALPLSAIPTFWAMSVMGFSLNLVSLLGITLVTGILVDDAIVEIENIVRHMRTGKTPYRAALEAADEIGLAVIAISLTIVAIFSPVSFMGGIAGQYFKQFGLTVAVAVLFSLLVARLITPMMAAYFLRPIPEKNGRRRADHAQLRRLPEGNAEGALPHACDRHGAVLRIDLRHLAAAHRLPSRRGHVPHRRLGRAAAGRHARGHAHQHRPHGQDAQDHSRGEERVRSRRLDADGRARGAQILAVRSPGAQDRAQADAKAAQNHHLQQACGRGGHARLVRERARRARIVVLDPVARRRRARSGGGQARKRDAPGSRLPQRRRRGLDRPAGAARRAQVRRGRPPGRGAEPDRGDDPRRHHRRHRRQSGQIQRRRPAGAHSRADRGERPHRPAAAQEPARDQHDRRGHSARRGGGRGLRPGSELDRPLRPAAARRDRRRPRLALCDERRARNLPEGRRQADSCPRA